MIDLSALPEYMHPGLIRYLEEGTRPGSFLTMVLENDFIGACGHADFNNRCYLYEYARILALDFPPESYGSKVKVQAWSELKGLKGRGA